jgi:hypothetical protein
MKNKKIYYSYKNEKREFLEIYWIKDKFINKGYHELTVNFNGAHHSYDMNDLIDTPSILLLVLILRI